jgi:putative salt-induced outer membrane protein YdiY
MPECRKNSVPRCNISAIEFTERLCMNYTLLPSRALRHAGAGLKRADWRALLVLVLAAFSTPLAAAPKTDVVVLRNGDRLTGEVKALQYNQLKFSTDSMGTIYIEWDKIASIESSQHLLLERTDGKRYYGQLQAGEGDSRLLLQRAANEPAEVIEMDVVVRAEPIVGGAFVDRLDGYVSAGLDLAKANNRNSVDLAGGLSARTRERAWELDGSINLTDDSSGATSERSQLEFDYRQFLGNRSFYLGFTGLERNTELDLNLRTMVGGGMGRFFVQTNHAEWVAGVGLAYSHENYTGGERFDSLEGVLTTSFKIFRYDFPETDVGGSFSLLPSLTQSGRYRAEGDLRAKYEFVDDLYFEVKLYGSYDSEPPLGDTEQSDYGLTTSLGYSF